MPDKVLLYSLRQCICTSLCMRLASMSLGLGGGIISPKCIQQF